MQLWSFLLESETKTTSCVSKKADGCLHPLQASDSVWTVVHKELGIPKNWNKLKIRSASIPQKRKMERRIENDEKWLLLNDINQH